MSAQMGQQIAEYLQQLVQLTSRAREVTDVSGWDECLWLADLPDHPRCHSAVHDDDTDGLDDDKPWLEVHQPGDIAERPELPQKLHGWIDPASLDPSRSDQPRLFDDGSQHRLPTDIASLAAEYATVWQVWADEVRPDFAAKRVYEQLFNVHRRLVKDSELMELVVGFGVLSWNRDGQRIRRHLVTCPVELDFDQARGILSVKLPYDGCKLSLEDHIIDPNVRPLRSDTDEINELLEEAESPPWSDLNLNEALAGYVHALDASGRYEDDLDAPQGHAGSQPRVRLSPALILRKRDDRNLVRLYEQLAEQLADGQMSPAWQPLVDADAVVGYDDHESSASSLDLIDPLLPLPSNAEQEHIVHALSHSNGVVVQGPPGTGKSHTIANLVCHLLSQGQRILVTAKTSRALEVLHDKLPEEVQPLCVSMLGQGGASFAALNRSITGITERYAQHDSEQIRKLSEELSSRRDQLRRER
ncbi:MAG: AAA family ATPase, partial [Fuerstiella sp.]|nr:AAA family ATPase [Fuerstiella sp.]